MHYVTLVIGLLFLVNVCGARIINLRKGEEWKIPEDFQECSTENNAVAIVISSNGQLNTTVTSSDGVNTNITSSIVRGVALGVTTITCAEGMGDQTIYVKVYYIV